jgi:hypothetical protein
MLESRASKIKANYKQKLISKSKVIHGWDFKSQTTKSMFQGKRKIRIKFQVDCPLQVLKNKA